MSNYCNAHVLNSSIIGTFLLSKTTTVMHNITSAKIWRIISLAVKSIVSGIKCLTTHLFLIFMYKRKQDMNVTFAAALQLLNVSVELTSLSLKTIFQFSSVSRSVMSDSLWPHGPQHAGPPCPSPTPRVHPNSCPLSRWCHPTISSSITPFSSCPQSFPASGSFQMTQHFTTGGQSIGVSVTLS